MTPVHVRLAPHTPAEGSWSAPLLAAVMLSVGVLHLVAPQPFDRIIPRVLPAGWRRPLTYASGVAEIVAGALVAVPATRRVGGRFTAALLVLVLPANVDAALRGGYPGLQGWAGSSTAAWLRVPLQIPLIGWALSVSRLDGPGRGDS
ncbi:MauE/DoxX family redox-associated membrane protein [Euzebya sp.]|uniref:DoxX family protein n=1 Tax=Euzebya sp. TaxID=1971409 RepID=UPI003515A942